MRHHLLTLAILVLALGLYTVGLGVGGPLALASAATFEAWFWVRLLRGRHRTGATDA